MNSIKFKNNALYVRNVFMKEVVPVSRLSKKEGKVYFPVGPDPNALTYYRKQVQTVMTPEDFEVSGCESLDRLEIALAELWSSQGHNELVPLSLTTSKLARLLHESEQESEQVSPFIYVMF